MDFFQKAPALSNQYDDDDVLKSFLEHHLPPELLQEIAPDLRTFGERVATDVRAMGENAESSPPTHVPYDAWGKRIDHVRVSKAWDELHAVAAQEGIVAIGYERKQAQYSRLYQFAKLYLFHPSSAIYSCPLAMTDGAARLLELHGDPALKERAFSRLTSRLPSEFWTSGQWMTERAGGSDVSGTETVAKLEAGQFRLYGTKWFTSATTSQMALTLARIEGESKLSLFYVELRNSQNELQHIQINRLKEKLGTRALPTAELTLLGTPATLIGEAGKGVKTIATVLNITRVYNACCAVGYMRRGLALAKDYAQNRRAFGLPLSAHGAHLTTLSDLQVRFEASFHLTFHVVKLLGQEEFQKNSAAESSTLRLLIPLVKLFTAKEGVSIASEILESFGGAGYVEYTHLPVLLRNAQVLSIWEGTTNVLALDVVRAIKRDAAFAGFLAENLRRLEAIHSPDLLALKKTVLEAHHQLQAQVEQALQLEDDDLSALARAIAFSMARTFAAALLLEHAQWEISRGHQARTRLVADRLVGQGLLADMRSSAQERTVSSKILGFGAQGTNASK